MLIYIGRIILLYRGNTNTIPDRALMYSMQYAKTIFKFPLLPILCSISLVNNESTDDDVLCRTAVPILVHVIIIISSVHTVVDDIIILYP